jgi:hypothetical protein
MPTDAERAASVAGAIWQRLGRANIVPAQAAELIAAAFAEVRAEQSAEIDQLRQRIRELERALREVWAAWNRVPVDAQVPDEINDHRMWGLVMSVLLRGAGK